MPVRWLLIDERILVSHAAVEVQQRLVPILAPRRNLSGYHFASNSKNGHPVVRGERRLLLERGVAEQRLQLRKLTLGLSHVFLADVGHRARVMPCAVRERGGKPRSFVRKNLVPPLEPDHGPIR